ncbi:Fermentation-respiration switch protein FrsA, has esterase activity, DUF1100 family [Frankineae bacterium MT45]|nr:Fermentation-respiration switch protein FrsA, has esterase activity, DUF1100 family [Frankineae bacterium MT45]
MPELADQSYSWSEESFLSGGTTCAARVYRPQSAGSRPAPVVVMAHGFGAVRALRLYAYAEHFAAAGYLVVVFDYRGFGESDGTPRQLLNVLRQHEDWRAALNFARSLPEADRDRVVAWGTSFSGGHVISLAGHGEPLAAIIAQVPHVSGPAAVRATGAMAGLRVGVVGVRDAASALLRRGPVYASSVGQPGETAVMTSPDAEAGLERLAADSGVEPDAYRRDVAARIVLTIGLYSPGRVASKVTCPALVQIAERDAVTPRDVAVRSARKMARATVRLYDCGHFEPYVEPLFSSVIADQLDFLRLNVPTG